MTKDVKINFNNKKKKKKTIRITITIILVTQCFLKFKFILDKMTYTYMC